MSKLKRPINSCFGGNDSGGWGLPASNDDVFDIDPTDDNDFGPDNGGK